MIQCQTIARQDELQGNLYPPNNTKILAPFSRLQISSRGHRNQKPRNHFFLFLVFSLQEMCHSAMNLIFSLIACWFLSFLQALSSTKVLDMILMKLRIPCPLQVTHWIPEYSFQGNATLEMKYKAAAELWHGKLHKCHQKLNHCLCLTGSVSVFLSRKAMQQWRLSLLFSSSTIGI